MTLAESTCPVSACWNNGEEGIGCARRMAVRETAQWLAGEGHLADAYVLNPFILGVGVIVTASYL